MKITVKEAFVWWEDGIRRVEYPPGDHDVGDACATYAVDAGFAEEKTTARAKK